MSIPILDSFVPKNNGTFPVVHSDYVQGGWHAVSDLTARNNIPTARRQEGMVVYVTDLGQFYTLFEGVTNSNWAVLNFNNFYVHTQSSPSTGWIISHNLGYRPNITAVNPSGSELEGRIIHTSGNNISVLYFNKAYAGSGYCS